MIEIRNYFEKMVAISDHDWAIFSSKLQAQNVLGIDVSKWQGTINWELVAEDGYVFSWVKATEGMTYTDPKFYTNIEGGIWEELIMGPITSLVQTIIWHSKTPLTF